MKPHLTDEQVLDLLAPGGEAAPDVRAHLAACAKCRARLDVERPLAERLAALGHETGPPRDLWPELAARIGGVATREASPWLSPALRAAAAVALFVLGAAAGRWSVSAEDPRSARLSNDPLSVAAEVQRTGTDYVAAVARFRTVAGSDEQAADQAREVALAAVLGVAWELSRLAPDDAAAREIALLVSEQREEAAP